MTLADAVGELEAIIARTALKYDLLPYESKPFAQSQPARLGAISRLFGLEAEPLAKARVLELGCASGGNLIPHAALYPDAHFVGVDLARTQVAAGRARIERLGLKNVEILCKSFTEIGEELGTFDYIICHGVYSWVPPQVQDAILKVIRARLSPECVACVSYNVLPGWRMMQPLRDALLLAIPDGTDSLGRVAMAREMLGFMSKTSPDKGPYGDTLRLWAERLATLPDDYIAHEFLEECNAPVLVKDFTLAANRHGLGFLGECELSAMILDNYGPELAEGVRARSGNDLVASEQWLDLLSGRTFRQTLLIASERMAGVNRNLQAEAVTDLHFVLPLGVRFEKDDAGATLTLADGRSVATQSPAGIRMLEAMAARHPGSSSLADFAAGCDAQERAEVLDLAYRMAVGGIAYLSSEPVACTVEAGEKPLASSLSRNDTEAGSPSTTNLRHETVGVDPGTAVILPLLDGEHGRSELEDALLAAAKSGTISLQRDGQPISDAKALRKTVEELLPGLLSGLAGIGILQK